MVESDYGLVKPIIIVYKCPDTRAEQPTPQGGSAQTIRRKPMNIVELLKEIELLSDDELKQIAIWVEFNLAKREKISTKNISL